MAPSTGKAYKVKRMRLSFSSSNMEAYQNYEGHATKRQRTDTGGRGIQSGARDLFDDQHKPLPSCVVHVSNLSENVSDADLVEALQPFGPISFVHRIQKGQALVEFEEMKSSKSCVEFTQAHPDNIINVGGKPAFFDYSNSARIIRPGENDSEANNVLLMTVVRPKYRITTDVIHTICKGFGNVLRIVIFKKNGVQAMVEFDTVQSATHAKQNLHNCDIYSGCCTLKIDFARPKTLTVYKNDGETYDYTNPGLNAAAQGRALLDDPPEPAYNGPTTMRREGPGGGPPQYGEYGMQGPGPQGGRRGGPPGFHDQGFGPGGPRGYPADRGDFGGYGGGHQMMGMQDPQMHQLGNGNPVVMVYNMNPGQMNCDKLFNLLCLYGNVIKVKFMKSKPGCAMAEMSDALSVERAITNLSNIEFFGSAVQLSFSKQNCVALSQVPGELHDGSPSCMDYTKSRNNRFRNKEAASKNRIQQPSKVLHFFNAHPESTPQTIKQVFINAGAKEPTAVKMFDQKSRVQDSSKADRSRTGLAEWNDRASAVEALCVANHTNMENPGGKWPYIFKLCFSNSPHAQ
ncbi:heterogeneous nuclear ribonucleoprotein L isoform X2 [Strongylocentrotus purpuratus]|uniref:RRM domain-containing protein n=1 Tax=Strongylocentrotus purpuratus TaxID=7668 RepID=A0A7M7TGP8_STRPU|nr:heterogeneous nuclear ribonucleoprotein L isoform X2 [Strongylocentrotus purpuratus]|eukprot:XP_785931.3 PREDICTED: heterogeneous nuclear ribonucleoprotein L [Strongylocentrotus purpuratus]